MGTDISFAGVVTGVMPYPVAARTSASITRRPLHVLTLTPFYPHAGDQGRGCFVAEPLAALAEQGVKNTVIAVHPVHQRISPASGSEAIWAGYPAVPGNAGLATAGAFLASRLLAEVRQLHRTHPVDLVHAHGALPCGHAAAVLGGKLGVPFVVTVHGLDAYSRRQAGWLFGAWCMRVSQMVYRSARSVICVSEKVRRQVIEGGGSVPTMVVYNGVDPELFAPGLSDEAPARVLSVGNLIAIKGHESLLRAVAACRSQVPQIECDLIGDGPERRRLQSLARSLGLRDKVRFLGRRTRAEVADAMRACTLFALPSQYEGLGCVYLEAMAAAKPVIACRGQGIEEVIAHSVNGWLVEPDNEGDLATAIARLTASSMLRRQLGEAARGTVLRDFTLQHQAERLAAVYRECAA